MGSITLAQITNLLATIGTIAGGMTGIGAMVHFAIVRPLRKFLRREIVENLVEINSSVNRLEIKMTEHMRDPGAHERLTNAEKNRKGS